MYKFNLTIINITIAIIIFFVIVSVNEDTSINLLALFLIIFLIVMLEIMWRYYKNSFYESDKFSKLKKEVKDDISKSNELNSNIRELMSSFSSKYYIKGGTYKCSLNVLNNAKIHPEKYISKYFKINMTEENLFRYDTMIRAYEIVDQSKKIIADDSNNLVNRLSDRVPKLILLFDYTDFMSKLGYRSLKFNELEFPTYIFKYESPKGNSKDDLTITLNMDNLKIFRDYIQMNVSKRSHSEYQRSLMSSNLREYIKIRDNFTCKICNNSIYNEPNLLLEIDHIVPLSKGGYTEISNLQTLCWKCNREKGTKIL